MMSCRSMRSPYHKRGCRYTANTHLVNELKKLLYFNTLIPVHNSWISHTPREAAGRWSNCAAPSTWPLVLPEKRSRRRKRLLLESVTPWPSYPQGQAPRVRDGTMAICRTGPASSNSVTLTSMLNRMFRLTSSSLSPLLYSRGSSAIRTISPVPGAAAPKFDTYKLPSGPKVMPVGNVRPVAASLIDPESLNRTTFPVPGAGFPGSVDSSRA
jgi:hypothetical protein